MNARMNEHRLVSDLLPTYVSGALDENLRRQVEGHLDVCGECRADLALWQSTADEVLAIDRAVVLPAGLLDNALERIRSEDGAPARHPAGGRSRWRWLVHLLSVQALLVRREIWPASAAIMLMGFVVALLTENALAFRVIAPLVAAACMSVIYGPENDPAYELSAATPTSPRQILLARLALVFGFNLGLALIISLGMLPLVSTPLYSELVLGWLAPMTFLSAFALVLSLWIGSSNAIALSYLVWLFQFFLGGITSADSPTRLSSPLVMALIDRYLWLWAHSVVLLALAVVLFILAFWLAGRQENRLQQFA